MHPSIARNLVYLPIQRATQGNLSAAINLWSSLEHQPEEQLLQYQTMALRALLEDVFQHIPFYRRLRLNEELKRQDPFEILRQLPVISKADLRQDLSLFRDERSKPKWRNTSGSTGTPLKICKDRGSLLQMDAAMHAVYSWHGIAIGDKQARIWGRSLNTNQKIIQASKDLLLNRRRISAFDLTKENSRSFFLKLKKFRPAFIYCYPNAAVLFTQQLQEMGYSGEELNLKAVICTAEPLLEEARSLLKSFFKCPIVGEYGTTENGILAMECEHGNMHILSQNVIIEYLRDNLSVRNGEPAEIVVTELDSRSVPFIRYRTGDLGRPSHMRSCACGRTLPLITLACGRDDSFVFLPDGRKVHVAVFVYILKEGILQFQAVQETLQQIRIKIVPHLNYDHCLEQSYLREIKRFLGDGIRIIFEQVRQIPPEPTGKVLYFVSKLKRVHV